MSWLGKVVGGVLGAFVGGPIGALVGAALGHGVDNGLVRLARDARLPPGQQARVQSAFFTATFTTLGHLAKSDGRVSLAEIALAEQVMAQMQLSPAMREAAITLFRRGKAADFDLVVVIDDFRRECQGRRMLVQMFLQIQLQAAWLEGEPKPAQRRVLEQIRAGLHIPLIMFTQMETLLRLQRQFAGAAGAGGRAGAGPASGSPRPTLAQAYARLGVSPKDPDAVVTKAYRRLLSQNHPDKLVSKGLPEEMMKLATHRTHEIRQAYEQIQAARGL